MARCEEVTAFALPPGTEVPSLPSRPLAGRVGRVSGANADGVGGLRLLMRPRVENTSASEQARPPPLAPPRHSLRSRGEGSRPARCPSTKPLPPHHAGTAAFGIAAL